MLRTLPYHAARAAHCSCQAQATPAAVSGRPPFKSHDGILSAHFSLFGLLALPPQSSAGPMPWALIIVTLLLLVCLALMLRIYLDKRNLARRLAASEKTELHLRLLSAAVDQSPTSVIITSADTAIEYVNPHFTSETGYSYAEVVGQTPQLFKSGQTPLSTYGGMWKRLMRGEPWIGELLNRRKSGELYWEEAHIAPVKDERGNITHYVAVKLDITERKQASERLALMAHYDVLTGLPNRALLFERLGHALALARRKKTRLALMFVDLDKFKPINDNLGHAIGDQVLQESARRMLACLRDSDTVGRIGGDEFVVLLPEVNGADDALKVAEKIRHALSQEFCACGPTVPAPPNTVARNDILNISASIGIALSPQDGDNAIELTKNADFAMYQAKLQGGDKVEIFNEPLLRSA